MSKGNKEQVENDKLQADLDMLVDVVKEGQPALVPPALDQLRSIIRSSTASMTSVPKPLKFLRGKYNDLKAAHQRIANEQAKRDLADIISILAMTISEDVENSKLKQQAAAAELAKGDTAKGAGGAAGATAGGAKTANAPANAATLDTVNGTEAKLIPSATNGDATAPTSTDSHQRATANSKPKRPASKASQRKKAASRRKKLAEANQMVEEVDLKKLRNRIKKKRRVRDLEQMVFYNINGIQVPVFTEEFLEQNKIQDGELRKLRKLNNDNEEHNSLLSKQLENLNLAILQLQSESKRLNEFNQAAKNLLRGTQLNSNSNNNV